MTLLGPVAERSAPPERFAAIADIHGNADALDAVLAAIAAELGAGALVVNLGDHLSGPLDPAGVAVRLMGLPEMVCLRGNHDRDLLEREIGEMSAADRVTREAIGAEAMGWLAALPATVRLGREVLLVHGTPGADDDYLLERATGGGLVARQSGEVAARLEGVDAGLVLCGHSHLQRQVVAGGRLVANPGSVGCPAYRGALPAGRSAEVGSPEARWAICARGAAGWTVDFRLASYDTARMAAAARGYGREDWAGAIEKGEMR